MKPLININHKSFKNAFIFNAVYSAIIFGLLFVIDDYIDDHILDKSKKNYWQKLLIHMVVVFTITFILVLFFLVCFWMGKNIFWINFINLSIIITHSFTDNCIFLFLSFCHNYCLYIYVE